MLIGFNFYNQFEHVLNLGTNEFLINGEKMKSSDARLTATIEITEDESMTEEEVKIKKERYLISEEDIEVMQRFNRALSMLKREIQNLQASGTKYSHNI